LEVQKGAAMNEDPGYEHLIEQIRKMEEDLKSANQKILEQQERLDETKRHHKAESCSLGAGIANIGQKLHVLSVEASDGDFRRIQSVLKSIDGILLSRANTLKDGLRLVAEVSPDLVLLDYLLPGGDGFDFIRALRADNHDIPLVILTGQRDEIVASRLIQEGADDYLAKVRFDRESIATCFRNVLEKGKLKREIRSAHRKISEMATLDEVTGLYNRRYFMEALERERARAERHGKDLSLCMMDLDLFKRINDKLGHTAGDLVLAGVGGLLREWSRQTDLPCRYGGEEFAVILPETDLKGARVVCERLRRIVAEKRVQWRTGPIQTTVSIGIAQNRTGAKDSVRKLIDRANEALSRAKEAGRNRVNVLDNTSGAHAFPQV
jgi:two-component system cell cycle response regulator